MVNFSDEDAFQRINQRHVALVGNTRSTRQIIAMRSESCGKNFGKPVKSQVQVDVLK